MVKSNNGWIIDYGCHGLVNDGLLLPKLHIREALAEYAMTYVGAVPRVTTAKWTNPTDGTVYNLTMSCGAIRDRDNGQDSLDGVPCALRVWTENYINCEWAINLGQLYETDDPLLNVIGLSDMSHINLLSNIAMAALADLFEKLPDGRAKFKDVCKRALTKYKDRNENCTLYDSSLATYDPNTRSYNIGPTWTMQ